MKYIKIPEFVNFCVFNIYSFVSCRYLLHYSKIYQVIKCLFALMFLTGVNHKLMALDKHLPLMNPEYTSGTRGTTTDDIIY